MEETTTYWEQEKMVRLEKAVEISGQDFKNSLILVKILCVRKPFVFEGMKKTLSLIWCTKGRASITYASW